MIPVNSPGLPPWPRLWFDQKSNRAIVTIRHPTWRSYECSYYFTEVVVWFLNGLTVYGVWKLCPVNEPFYRLLIVFLTCCFLIPLVSALTRLAFRDPLARQLFATQTVFWVTREAIIFRSRLYSGPVVLWRSWKGRRITPTFIVGPDLDAASYLKEQNARKFPQSPISEAAILEVVIATPQNQHVPSSGSGLRKSVPVTEVSERNAQKFTTVFAAAILLMSSSEEDRKRHSGNGLDIDIRPIGTGQNN